MIQIAKGVELVSVDGLTGRVSNKVGAPNLDYLIKNKSSISTVFIGNSIPVGVLLHDMVILDIMDTSSTDWSLWLQNTSEIIMQRMEGCVKIRSCEGDVDTCDEVYRFIKFESLPKQDQVIEKPEIYHEIQRILNRLKKDDKKEELKTRGLVNWDDIVSNVKDNPPQADGWVEHLSELSQKSITQLLVELFSD